jgi:ParB family transcriptional regulator, chromosome partitioning protein
VADIKKKGLGKGLGALIGASSMQGATSAPVQASPTPQTLPDGSHLLLLDPREVVPNPKQPRRVFREEALQELADSIRRDGVQEPVIVRQVEGRYELVSGERRVRASIMADLEGIPAVCRDVTDRDMLRLGLIENIQREDLNAIEQALAYQELIQEFNWTQEQLAKEVGKNRVTVANIVRLLNLPQVLQDHVAEGTLTMGHARALLAIEDGNRQLAMARKIIAEGLSVRQAEKLAAEGKAPRAKAAPSAKDPNIAQIESELRRSLGTKVAVRQQTPTSGKIEIEYFNLDDLDRLLGVLRPRR